MTAPTNPTPDALPVVALNGLPRLIDEPRAIVGREGAVLTITWLDAAASAHRADRLVRADAPHHAARVAVLDGDLPALAVPDLIWTATAFLDAILARSYADTWEYACEYEKEEWRAALLEDMRILHAELRARAEAPK